MKTGKDTVKRSYIVFFHEAEGSSRNITEDPVYQLRAKDPAIRIRRNVHTGCPGETGYAIQIFADTGEQSRIICGYLKNRGIESCLVVMEYCAFVWRINRNICHMYSGLHYCTKEEPEESNTAGYNIHLEDSRWV